MNQTCSQCLYFKLHPNEMVQGECHRFPPQVNMIMAQGLSGRPEPRFIGSFTPVQAHMWCGEWSVNINLTS